MLTIIVAFHAERDLFYLHARAAFCTDVRGNRTHLSLLAGPNLVWEFTTSIMQPQPFQLVIAFADHNFWLELGELMKNTSWQLTAAKLCRRLF